MTFEFSRRLSDHYILGELTTLSSSRRMSDLCVLVGGVTFAFEFKEEDE